MFYLLSHVSSPFGSGYFWDRISLFAPVDLGHDPHKFEDDTPVIPCPPFSMEVGFLELFPPGWPQTLILLLSVFWVPKIAGMSHWHLTCRWFLLLHSLRLSLFSWILSTANQLPDFWCSFELIWQWSWTLRHSSSPMWTWSSLTLVSLPSLQISGLWC